MFTIEELMSCAANSAHDCIGVAIILSYVIGAYMIVSVIFGISPFLLTTNDQEKTKSERHFRMFLRLGTGAALIYLPSTISAGTVTLLDQSSEIMGYDPVSSDDIILFQTKQAMYFYIKLIGIIAVVRSLVIFNHLPSNNEKHPGAKAVTLFMGGVLCLNLPGLIDTFLYVFQSTLSSNSMQLWTYAISLAIGLFVLGQAAEVISTALGRNTEELKSEREKQNKQQHQ